MTDDLFAEPVPSAASGAPSIPSVLTALRSWLVWRLVQKPGEKKPRKVPFYVDGGPRSGTQGTPDDRRRLATYPEAVAACQRGRYTGLGLAVLPGDGVVALDFDNCVVDGVIDRRIEALISETYAEISPSGTGVRAFMLGDLLSRKDNADKADRNADGSRKDGQFDIEFFGNSGFVTITANPTPDCTLFGLTDTVVPLTPEVLALYRARFNTDGALVVRSGGLGGGAGAGGGDDDEADLFALTSAPLGWSIDEARTVLFACDPSASREKWLHALMAVHHELGGSPEALDLCDEWSAQGASYAGREDVEGRWRSFGRGSSSGTITGRWLVAWSRECSAHLKYDAVAERRSEIGAAVDEFTLRERVCPEIARDLRLDDFGREALALALESAFKKLGCKYPIAQCRKLVAEKRAEKAVGNSAPPWLKDWVYVSDDDKFYRIDSDEWLSMQGFNARFNREVPMGEDGTISKSAAWLALEDYAIPNVTRSRYLPWAGSLFDMDGVKHINSYRPSSVPGAVERLSEAGRAAVNVVMRHLNLLCGGREPVVQTLVDWMAHNVQHPGVKVRWAPLIKGVEGDGKTVLGSIMAAVMGRSNVRNVSPKVLGTDFTGWAEGSCVAVLEEIKLTGHNRYDILNALKPFVTNDSIEVHRKGKDTYDAVNTTNYIAFTNYPDALPLTDTDRRWWIVFSPFTHKDEMEAAIRGQAGAAGGDVLGAYFDALHAAVQTCCAELRRWLLDWPIAASFKPNGSAPMTEEKGVMIGMSVSDEEIVLKELLEKGAEGVTSLVFASSYLSKEVFRLGEEINTTTNSWNHLLKRLGYTRLPKKIKWRGKTEIVWVKGHKHWEPQGVRKILDKTVVENEGGSQSDDLF